MIPGSGFKNIGNLVRQRPVIGRILQGNKYLFTSQVRASVMFHDCESINYEGNFPSGLHANGNLQQERV